VPYLKGLHLSLDSWWKDRDEDGWRTTNTNESLWDGVERLKAPKDVQLVQRFRSDMEALMFLTKVEEPPPVPVRPTACKATFLVGDALGSGFGTSTWVQNDDKITAQYGAWDDNVRNQSSNFREAYNLVLRVEQMVERGELERGSEVFVFTDNFIPERAFYNGSSKSKRLHGLVMRLRKLEMDSQIFICVIWFAGTRMINQATDGLSCGDFTGGVIAGGVGS
jgi:hypothetical protein